MSRSKQWKFKDHIDDWVYTVDDPFLNRAWGVVCACINAHAIAERDPEENLVQVRREAWKDFFEAWFGGDATLIYTGMVAELSHFCPAGLDSGLDACLREAHFIFRGLPIPSAEPTPPVLDGQGRPRLVLVTSNHEVSV